MQVTPTPEQSRPRTRLALVAALVAALAVGALPASASASFLLIAGNGDLVHNGTSRSNSLSVRQAADAMIVTDTSGLSNHPSASPARLCAQVDRQTMRCPMRFIRRVESHMEAGDDVAGPIHTSLPVEINGEGDADTYQAGNPSFLTNVKFAGGGGPDTASYAGSGGSGGGRGVRITNDGQPNDGRVGLDTDNIARDVITLIGSPFGDEITASVNSDLGRVFVTPGNGEDVFRAGSGPANGIVFFLGGSVADGADKIIGGPVPSVVDYNDRTRPVNATLNSGGADDGEAGERDEIIGGHEFVNGGQAGDTLRAARFSTVPVGLSGRGGDDTLDGADGNDSLNGGDGADVIRAFGGDDSISVNDQSRDVAGCGLGTDSIRFDSRDAVEACESGQLVGSVGALRLTPKALKVKAGELARVRLSWRHPRGWRQLRTVELRIYRGKARVGGVAISPRGRQLKAYGAVRLGRNGDRLARNGKTVSARLAIRLDRKLAGKRLRLEVKATDSRGAQQLERRAGSIRVVR